MTNLNKTETQGNPSNCPACGSENIEGMIEYLNADWPRAALFQNLAIALCTDCGLGFVAPNVPIGDLSDFYTNIFRAKGNRDYFNPAIVQYHRWSMHSRSLSQILLGLQYTDLKPGDRFLDVGAGMGSSFDVVRKICPGIKLAVVEPSRDLGAMFRRNFPGISVESDLGSEPENDEAFKIVLMSHSLEHFNPGELVSTLTQISTNLKDKGVLIVEVPHVDLRRDEFVQRPNDAPHLCFFSVEALKAVLERSGFQVLFINTCDRMVRADSGPRSNSRPTAPRIGPGWRARLSAIVPASLWRLASRLRHPFTDIVAFISGGDPRLGWATSATTQYGGDRSCIRVVAKRRTESNQIEVLDRVG